MSVIYLIRHGQASFGAEDYDRLSDLGVRQSRLLGAYFRRTGIRFDRVYSGSLARQVGTAQEVLSEMPGAAGPEALSIVPEFDEFADYSACVDRLTELAARDPAFADKVRSMMLNPRSFEEATDRMLESLVNDTSLSSAGAAWRAFEARVAAGLERVRVETAADRQAAVFTSGGTILAAMQRVTGGASEANLALVRQIRNTSYSILLSENGWLSLTTCNALPHLEEQRDPALITFV